MTFIQTKEYLCASDKYQCNLPDHLTCYDAVTVPVRSTWWLVNSVNWPGRSHTPTREQCSTNNASLQYSYNIVRHHYNILLRSSSKIHSEFVIHIHAQEITENIKSIEDGYCVSNHCTYHQHHHDYLRFRSQTPSFPSYLSQSSPATDIRFQRSTSKLSNFFLTFALALFHFFWPGIFFKDFSSVFLFVRQ